MNNITTANLRIGHSMTSGTLAIGNNKSSGDINIMNNANERIQEFLRTHIISEDDKKDQEYFECVSNIKDQLKDFGRLYFVIQFFLNIGFFTDLKSLNNLY